MTSVTHDVICLVTKLASLKLVFLMENSRKMQTVPCISNGLGDIAKNMFYNNLHGILSIGLLCMLNSENFFSSGANVAVAGLHLYVFLIYESKCKFWCLYHQYAQCYAKPPHYIQILPYLKIWSRCINYKLCYEIPIKYINDNELAR